MDPDDDSDDVLTHVLTHLLTDPLLTTAEAQWFASALSGVRLAATPAAREIRDVCEMCASGAPHGEGA